MDTDHGGASAAGMDEAEAAFFARQGRRCCCFPWPSSTSAHQRVGAAVGEEESWLQRAVDAVLKVREWSELVAGPRWKTFIRRFGRNAPPRPHHHFGRKLNYDALSYALNFDEGPRATTPATATSPPASSPRRSPPSRPWTSAAATRRRFSLRRRHTTALAGPDRPAPSHRSSDRRCGEKGCGWSKQGGKAAPFPSSTDSIPRACW